MTGKERAALRRMANTIQPIFQIGKGGVVRDAKVHEQVCLQIMEFAQKLGFGVRGLEISPITGLRHPLPGPGGGAGAMHRQEGDHL